MEEFWVLVPGYDQYLLSNFGKVLSLKRGKELKQKMRLYPSVALYNKHGKKDFNVHRMLANCFIDDKFGNFVNHKDGNKLNNSLDNLEWCTAKQNIRHAIKLGLINTTVNRAEKNGRSKLSNRDVIEIREIYNHFDGLNEHIFTDIGEVYNVSRTTIYRIIKGSHWKSV